MKHYIQTGKHGILVPKYKDMGETMKVSAGVAGHFTLVTHSERYGSRVRADFDNLILDSGLNRLATGVAITACQVGSGSTTPAVNQTALAAHVAGTTTFQAYTDTYNAGPPDYWESYRVFRFGTGVAAGNLAEVGVGWGTSGTTLFSRALILDALGNPTSLTILSDEVLDVYYRIRWYPPMDDTAGTVVLAGTTHDVTYRASGTNNASYWACAGVQPNNPTTTGLWAKRWQAETFFGNLWAKAAAHETQTLGLRTSQPSGTGSSPGGQSVLAYSDMSMTVKNRWTWGLNDGNFATGIGSMWGQINSGTDDVTGPARFQASFTPKIPKDANKVLTLEMAFSYTRV